MKIGSLIFKILIGVFLAIIIIFLNLNSGYDIIIDIDENVELREPVKIDLQVTYNLEQVTPDELEIEIYNRYNKEETIDYMLTPLNDGTYSIVITPKFEGEYIVNVTTEIDNQTFNKSTTFEVD